MPQTLHLLVFPTRASKINGNRAHWALFLTSPSPNTPGKLIQVLGTPFTGYGLEFKRNYSLDVLRENFQSYELGEVVDVFVAFGDDDNRKQSTDCTPRDVLERLAGTVEPPGVSRSRLDPAVVSLSFEMR